MARVDLRTVANKSGIVYDEDKTTFFFAEDYEAIKDAIDDGTAGINTEQLEIGGTTIINSSGVVQVGAGCVPGKDEALGSDCNGSDGAINRVLTLTNTGTTTEAIVMAGGKFLRETLEYTIAHNAGASKVTFLVAIWDSDQIEVIYFQ